MAQRRLCSPGGSRVEDTPEARNASHTHYGRVVWPLAQAADPSAARARASRPASRDGPSCLRDDDARARTLHSSLLQKLPARMLVARVAAARRAFSAQAVRARARLR